MTDPMWADVSGGAPSYNSAELRRLHAVALQYNGRTVSGKAGVRPGGNALETSVSGGIVTVRAGLGVIDPALTTTQGAYWVCQPTDWTGAFTAAHATLARKDITVWRIYDHTEDSSGLRQAIPEYITGTASGSPTEPAVPAGSFKLATIDVASVAVGTPPVVTMSHPFTVASGGILPVRNQAERDALSWYDGQAAYRMDRDWLEIRDNSAWRVQGVAICASTTDRDSAITGPQNGLLVPTLDTGIVWQRQGGAWRPIGPRGVIGGRMITGTNNLGAAITTSEAAPTNMDSGTVALLANRRYRIWCRYQIKGSVDLDNFTLRLRQAATAGTGGTEIGQHIHNTLNSALGYTDEFTADYETGGSDESKVFTMTGVRASGTGNMQARGGGSGTTNRVGVWVEDVGPANLLTSTAS